jgi:UDP-galactopyranose mutase
MWGLEIEELDPSILSRVPIRKDLNELYFPNDTFQALPKEGYSEMVRRILDHPNIKVSLNTAFSRGMEMDFLHTFNSMPIDEYFDFDLGELPYRSIKFHTYTLPAPRLLPVACVNFTHDGPSTRVTEWKHFPNSGNNPYFTTITVEEPCDYKENNYETYYPVKDIFSKNKGRYTRYASRCPADVSFIGRCGLYAYLDMHQAVSSSLAIANRFKFPV